MNYHWNWGILFAQEPGGTGTYLHYLLVGLLWTLVTGIVLLRRTSGATARVAYST